MASSAVFCTLFQLAVTELLPDPSWVAIFLTTALTVTVLPMPAMTP